jgi:predicted GNAT family acetyltransferase
MSDTQLTNNLERSRFELRTDDGRLAGFAEYVDRDDVREFVHTVVRDEFEGQGIGSTIARGALDATREDGRKVIATCPFIKGWIGKHPDYEDILA